MTQYKNPYSEHDLQGEAAFLEQLAQVVTGIDMLVQLSERVPQNNYMPEIVRLSNRLNELYRLRVQEKRSEDDPLFI
jgi:hypothetical protein